MSAADIILIALIAAALTAAVWLLVKRRKSGKGCCGDCSRCTHSAAGIVGSRTNCDKNPK